MKLGRSGQHALVHWTGSKRDFDRLYDLGKSGRVFRGTNYLERRVYEAGSTDRIRARAGNPSAAAVLGAFAPAAALAVGSTRLEAPRTRPTLEDIDITRESNERPVPYGKLIKQMKKRGWVYVRRGRGSHDIWRFEPTGIQIVLPERRKKEPVGQPFLRQIRQAESGELQSRARMASNPAQRRLLK